MDKLLKEFHVLDTRIGPIGFHGPSAKFFELPPDIAATVAALETGEQSLHALAPTERGGEPLLNLPLIQKVIDRVRAKTEPHGIRTVFNMTTNGTVWNSKIAEFVDKNIDTLTVSLDGPKDINDAQRPSCGNFSSYDKTVRTIDNLKEQGSRYTIRTIMTKNSFGRLKEIYSHNSELAGKGGVGLSSHP